LRHCRELGVNRDVLRARFAERYKLSPSEYRINRRLKRILYLFTYSDMSLKEIAGDVGMKNVTHLNAVIRKYYDKTPRQLCLEYRSSR
jgi:AraC-like DNA-binding protein